MGTAARMTHELRFKSRTFFFPLIPIESHEPSSSVFFCFYCSGPYFWILILKVGLGIFDFRRHSRRLISKDSISSPNFSCGCSYAERALWCRDSKHRALGNYFPVQIYYEFRISKCRGDCDLGLCTFWELAFINPLSDGKIRFFLRAKRVFFSRK